MPQRVQGVLTLGPNFRPNGDFKEKHFAVTLSVGTGKAAETDPQQMWSPAGTDQLQSSPCTINYQLCDQSLLQLNQPHV